MPLVASDNDLPKLLNTPSKQMRRLKKLVLQHLGSASKQVDRPPMQGMYSRTFLVTLADNVLVDEDCEVTGLIDWELSTPKPFGVGFGRIHTLAGEYTGGEFWMPDEFEDAERGFWEAQFDGMPAKTRAVMDQNIPLVQDAVILGTLLDVFFCEDGNPGCGQVSIKALPQFLTYRIPFVRGYEPPYRK